MDSDTQQQRKTVVLGRAGRYGLASVLVLWLAFWGFLGLVAPNMVRNAAQEWAHSIGRSLEIGDVSIHPWSMSLELGRVRLLDKDGRPLFIAQHVVLNTMPRALLIGHWHAELLALNQAQWFIERDKQGSWNWARLVHDAKGPGPSGPTPKILLDKLSVLQGQVVFEDQAAGGARYRFEKFNLNLHDLSTLPAEGGYVLSAALGEKTQLKWRGSLGLEPLSSAGRISLSNLNLASVWQYAAPYVRLPAPTGNLSFDMNYIFDLKGVHPHLTLSSIFSRIDALGLQAPDGQHRLSLPSAAFEDGIFDLQKHSLFFKRIRLRDGDLSAARAADGTLNWQAAWPNRPAAQNDSSPDWKVQVNDLRLENWKLGFSDASFMRPLQINTELPTLSFGLRQNTRQGLTIERLSASLKNLQLGVAGQPPVLAAGLLQLSGASLAAHQIHPGAVTVLQPVLKLERSAQGSINLASMFVSRLPRAPVEKTAAAPWKWSVPRLGVSNGQLSWRDAPRSHPVALTLDQITGSLVPHETGGLFDANFTANAGQGRMNFSAVLDPAAGSAKGRLTTNAIPLVPLAPYALSATPLTLTRGTASAALDLTADAQGWRLAGQAGVADLAIQEPGEKAPLLAWHALNLTGLKLSGSPLVVSVRDVQLDQPEARLVFDQKRVSNIRRLFSQNTLSANSGKTTPTPFDIRTIHVRNGHLDFADQGMNPMFSSKIHSLTGSITGLSSRNGRRGTLALNGEVDKVGDVRVRGALAPLAFTDNADVTLMFRNIPLNSLNTYSENIAGWQIQDGRLSVELHYVLNQKKLIGDNRIVVESIKLGQQVERPGVSRLPLSLAVAVLEDSNGRIDLRLPVSGNLDDPQFSYGGLVWQAFVNVVQKVAMAPLRALGSLFGLENFDNVRFVAGEAALAPPERQKLGQLAQMLAERPRLKLRIAGAYDPIADRKEMARARVDTAILHAAGSNLAPGEPLPEIDLQDPEMQAAVKTMFAARVGHLKLVARMLADSGKPDFYAALRREAIKQEPVDSAALLALARARADSALKFLLQNQPSLASRISLDTVQSTHASADGVPMSIDLQGL